MMKKLLVAVLLVFVSCSAFAQKKSNSRNQAPKISSQQDRMRQRLIDMTKDADPEIQVIGSNLANFYLEGVLAGKTELTTMVQNFSNFHRDEGTSIQRDYIANNQIQSLLMTLKGLMDAKIKHGDTSGDGLKVYSPSAQNALLTFVELYYRDEETDHKDVPDFLYMFDQVGIPHLNKIRHNLKLPKFNDPEVCSRIIDDIEFCKAK